MILPLDYRVCRRCRDTSKWLFLLGDRHGEYLCNGRDSYALASSSDWSGASDSAICSIFGDRKESVQHDGYERGQNILCHVVGVIESDDDVGATIVGRGRRNGRSENGLGSGRFDIVGNAKERDVVAVATANHRDGYESNDAVDDFGPGYGRASDFYGSFGLGNADRDVLVAIYSQIGRRDDLKLLDVYARWR